MNPSPIFFVAGAPAVGKSTTAQALAARFPKSIHISVDDLRDMVVSGRLLPGEDWSAGLVEQLKLARECAIQMALKYQRAGFVVVIDDFWDTFGWLREYETFFQQAGVHKFLLLPSRQTADARNLKRAGSFEAGQYIAIGISVGYEHLADNLPKIQEQGWIVVDSTDKSVEETVSHILVLAG
jgi:hypothetical protein